MDCSHHAQFLTLKKRQTENNESIWSVDGADGVFDLYSSSSDVRGKMGLKVNLLCGLTFDNSVSIVDPGHPVFVNDLGSQLAYKEEGWQLIDHSYLQARGASFQILRKLLNFSSHIVELPKVQGDTPKGQQRGGQKLYVYHILFNSCCASVGISYLNQKDTNLKIYLSISLKNTISSQVRTRECQVTVHLNQIEPNYSTYDHCFLYSAKSRTPIACCVVSSTIDVMVEDGTFVIVLAKLSENRLETISHTISFIGNSYQIHTDIAREQQLEETRKLLFMEDED